MPRSSKARNPKLSARERRFVDAFLGSAFGNATKAAREAGYAKTTAEHQASRLLGRVGVKAAIDARMQKRENLTDVTNEEIDRELASIARDRMEQTHNRLSAWKEINKTRGRHSVRVQVDGHLKLEDAIGRAARELEEENAGDRS